MKKTKKILIIFLGLIIAIFTLFLVKGLFMKEEKTSFDLIVDVEKEDEIIFQRCRSKVKKPIVIWENTVGRTPEVSISPYSVRNGEYINPEGFKKKGTHTFISMWPTGSTSMPGDKNEDVIRIYIGIGDEFFAGERKFKVVDIYKGYVTEDMIVRSFICLDEIKQEK